MFYKTPLFGAGFCFTFWVAKNVSILFLAAEKEPKRLPARVL